MYLFNVITNIRNSSQLFLLEDCIKSYWVLILDANSGLKGRDPVGRNISLSSCLWHFL